MEGKTYVPGGQEEGAAGDMTTRSAMPDGEERDRVGAGRRKYLPAAALEGAAGAAEALAEEEKGRSARREVEAREEARRRQMQDMTGLEVGLIDLSRRDERWGYFGQFGRWVELAEGLAGPIRVWSQQQPQPRLQTQQLSLQLEHSTHPDPNPDPDPPPYPPFCPSCREYTLSASACRFERC